MRNTNDLPFISMSSVDASFKSSFTVTRSPFEQAFQSADTIDLGQKQCNRQSENRKRGARRQTKGGKKFHRHALLTIARVACAASDFKRTVRPNETNVQYYLPENFLVFMTLSPISDARFWLVRHRTQIPVEVHDFVDATLVPSLHRLLFDLRIVLCISGRR